MLITRPSHAKTYAGSSARVATNSPIAAALTFNEHIEALVALRRDLDVQFKRIAQLPAEIDDIKRTLSKLMFG